MPRDVPVLVESLPDSREVVPRKAEYDWPFARTDDLPLMLLEFASFGGFRGVSLRGPVTGCDVVWSNLFFRSFTLGWPPPLYPLLVADLALAPSSADLSSTGLDAER